MYTSILTHRMPYGSPYGKVWWEVHVYEYCVWMMPAWMVIIHCQCVRMDFKA